MDDILTPRTKEEIEYEERQNLSNVYKNNIKIEKGAVLTSDYLNLHKSYFIDLMNKFTAYPDIFLDLIQNPNRKTNLFFYQRIVLRAMMRFKDIYITASRAFSKSFLIILGLFLQCIFMPGTKRFIAAPFKTQSAAIAKEKLIEIYDRWPLLQKEVVGCELSDIPGNFGKDYVEQFMTYALVTG